MGTFEFITRQYDKLLELTLDHLWLVMSAVLTATVIGVALALLTYRHRRIANAVMSVESVFLTIPSFALFGILIGFVGLGFKPSYFALVLYSLLPITRNTIAGLRGVEPAIVDAARGMGMSRTRILLRIELPLAWPVIITGMRVSTLLSVGIAAIAAFVNGPGLGEFIFGGLSRIGGATAQALVISGTLGVLVLGLLLDIGFLFIGKLTTPRGIRG